MSTKRDVEFLFEIGAMRHIPRQWHRFNGVPFASLTEHHYRVMWLALLIATREGCTNTDKILKMALVHDIAESRAGDVDYLSRQYVVRDEEQAIKDILDDTVLADSFIKVWQEYELRESLEAKIVKDADNLDVDLDLREQGAAGHQIEAAFSTTRLHVGATKLYTKSAKELFKAIRQGDPHDWHVQSPKNRLHGGDWQKKPSSKPTKK